MQIMKNKTDKMTEYTDYVITLKRGTQTEDAVENVSNYLLSLNLTDEENNRLVDLMKIMLMAAETEQYAQGFCDGCKMMVE